MTSSPTCCTIFGEAEDNNLNFPFTDLCGDLIKTSITIYWPSSSDKSKKEVFVVPAELQKMMFWSKWLKS